MLGALSAMVMKEFDKGVNRLVNIEEKPDGEGVEGGWSVESAFLGIFGPAVLYAAEICLVCASALRDGSSLLVFAACFFLSMGLCYFWLRKGSSSLRKALLAGPGIGTNAAFSVKMVCYGAISSGSIIPAFLLPASDGLGFAVKGALGIAAGFSAGLLKLSWTGHLGRHATERRSRAGIPLLVGCLVALVVVWLDSFAGLIVLAMLPLLSAIALLMAIALSGCSGAILESRDDSSYLNASNHLLLFGYLSIYGYCLGTFSLVMDRAVSTVAIVASFVLIAFFVFAKKEHRTAVGDAAKVYLPLCVVLGFLLLSDEWALWVLAVVAALPAALFQGCSNIAFLENMANKLGVDTVAMVASGRFPPLLGLGFGIGLSAALRIVMLPSLAMVVPCCLLVLIVFSYAMLPFNQGNPMSSGIVRDLDEGIVPLFLNPGDEDSEQSFNRECDRMASEYGLSPREEEVFHLLARGYSTPIIAERLFISNSTVKTHCFRIYQKLGVHSRQDIIGLMQSRI